MGTLLGYLLRQVPQRAGMGRAGAGGAGALEAGWLFDLTIPGNVGFSVLF